MSIGVFFLSFKVVDDDIEVMQTDTATNGVSDEQPSSLTDAQNSLISNNVRKRNTYREISLISNLHCFQPFVIQPPVAQSTLTDDNSISVAKGNQG